MIAIFAYYFEVISRYVFFTPTNRAHGSKYPMFGMLYLIAGAYRAFQSRGSLEDIEVQAPAFDAAVQDMQGQ